MGNYPEQMKKVGLFPSNAEDFQYVYFLMTI